MDTEGLTVHCFPKCHGFQEPIEVINGGFPLQLLCHPDFFTASYFSESLSDPLSDPQTFSY